MPYDPGLAERLRDVFDGRTDIIEKKMFGGLAFMLNGNMCVGIVKDQLMARVGPDAYEAALAQPHVAKMDFTGRPLKGYVYVSQDGLADAKDLAQWVAACERFAHTLPPK